MLGTCKTTCALLSLDPTENGNDQKRNNGDFLPARRSTKENKRVSAGFRCIGDPASFFATKLNVGFVDPGLKDL